MARSLEEAPVDIGDSMAADEAYTQIKEWIATLVLRPGATVREADLQELVGVRRTPLREALHRLADQRMLTIYPRHGIVIATLGVNDIREIYEVRLVLESAAAGFAAQRRNEAELADLQALGQELREAREQGDIARYDTHHRPFHRLLGKMARNRTMDEYIEHALTLNGWLWNIYADARGERVAELTDHDPIVAAITAGNGPEAEAVVRAHILSAKERLLGGL